MKIKFLTLNIWFGGYVFDTALEFLSNQNADILTLQETYGPQSPMIVKLKEKESDYKYHEFAPMVERPDGTQDGPLTLSKFPITQSKITFFDIPYGIRNGIIDQSGSTDFSRTPRNMLYTQIIIEDKILNLFNIHGIWGFDPFDNERRLNMSRIIVEQIKDKENVILAGDFNMQRGTKSIDAIEEYLINVFGDELKTSFNMKHKLHPNYAKTTVDMILVSPNIKVLEHYCPQVDVSDHMPLVTVLEI